MGDVAECCDSHRCASDPWVVCKSRLPRSGWLKCLSGVRQGLLFRAKWKGSQSEETEKQLQSEVQNLYGHRTVSTWQWWLCQVEVGKGQ